MITFLVALIIFIQILEYIVILDIILSWLQLVGIKFRPRFIQDILTPLYRIVQKYIPTRFGAFDFTPILIILILSSLRLLIELNFPGVTIYINEIISQ